MQEKAALAPLLSIGSMHMRSVSVRQFIPLLLVVALCGCSAGKTGQSNTLVWRFMSDPPSLDPAHSTDTTSGIVTALVFDGLVELDPATLKIVPAVAESWEVSEDQLTYTFHLRRGVKFHHGREVKANDFRYTFERTMHPDTASERTWVLEFIKGADEFRSGKAKKIEGVEVLDDYTLRLTQKQPYPLFLEYLYMDAANVIPREVAEKWGDDFVDHLVGCGPYKFVRWKRYAVVELEAFDDYYGGRPKIDRLEFKIIPYQDVALLKYEEGELDVLDELPTGRVRETQKNYPEEFKVWPILGTYYIAINNEKPPFRGNVKLRQALNYAIDKQAICDAILEGVPLPAKGVLPPGIPSYNPDLRGYPYDPERAKKLLAEAGYANGEGLEELELWYNTNQAHERICIQVQNHLRAIGIKVRLRNVDWGSHLEACKSGEPKLMRAAWLADVPDPENFLYVLLHSEKIGTDNYSRYSNPEFDKLVEKARFTADTEQRIALYRQAEKMALDDATWIFIYYYGDVMMVKPHVKGVILPVQGDFRVPLDKLWLEGKR
jgi:peptide/nickel transport system substrate-binding protein/oligopeptide transport system substrate-binding protein